MLAVELLGDAERGVDPSRTMEEKASSVTEHSVRGKGVGETYLPYVSFPHGGFTKCFHAGALTYRAGVS